jgi:hypothetical protein
MNKHNSTSDTIYKFPASSTPLLSKHQRNELIPNAELGQTEAGHREAIEPEVRTKDGILRVHFLHNWRTAGDVSSKVAPLLFFVYNRSHIPSPAVFLPSPHILS